MNKTQLPHKRKGVRITLQLIQQGINYPKGVSESINLTYPTIYFRFQLLKKEGLILCNNRKEKNRYDYSLSNKGKKLLEYFSEKINFNIYLKRKYSHTLPFISEWW